MAADLLTLASAVVPNRDDQLAQFFKVPLNDDGFFVESTPNWAPPSSPPTAFSCVAGPLSQAHRRGYRPGPRPPLAGGDPAGPGNHHTSGKWPVDPQICSQLRCVCVHLPLFGTRIFPADARMFAGKAEINPVLCKGCGLCVASCRSGAIHLKGFDNDQIFARCFCI
jgi:heterodisulfide reductase subunit A